MKIAPILLFAYKRLDTLIDVVDSLKANPLSIESDLHIFSDAAKKVSDEPVVSSVRSYLKTITGFKNIYLHEASQNKGLARSIIDGTNLVFKDYDRVIVLEDDIKTSTNFLHFMNTSLEMYIHKNIVFSISAFSFDLGLDDDDPNDAYFLNRGWSWGWATWKDRWEGVDWEVKDYKEFRKDRNKRKKFSMGGSDLNKMLDSQMTAQLDSWAIRWFYSQFKVNGLTLYPVKSKALNLGFDENATHTTGSSKRYLPVFDITNNTNFNFPSQTKLSEYYQGKFLNKMGILARIKSKIESFILKLSK